MIPSRINTISSENCYGCGACVQVCPASCITMTEDSEGFLIPRVNLDKCLGCGRCESVCISGKQKNTDAKVELNQKVYAARSKDNNIVKRSTSGGLFTVIAMHILEMGGSVFACAMDSEWSCTHIEITDQDMLNAGCGSKYVQSNTANTFITVKERLSNKQNVLYTGTACQIAGLKSYLGKDYDNLYTIDVLCTGVPSPLFFKKYISYLDTEYKKKVVGYCFRNKEKKGWGQSSRVEFNKGYKVKNSFFDSYLQAFYKAQILRECCYKCRFACSQRESDITLGDYWGIEKEHPYFYSPKGNSLVIINTKKGGEVLNSINEKVCLLQSEYSIASKYNHSLYQPTARPVERDYLKRATEMPYIEYIHKYLYKRPGITALCSAYCPDILKRIAKQCKLIKYKHDAKGKSGKTEL